MDEVIRRELEALEAQFGASRRAEAEAEARDLHAAHERSETLRSFLLELPVGLVVGLVTLDGAELWGRVDAVGADKLRLAETPREPGARHRARPRRLHDVRLDAVVRVVRDVAEWAR